MSCPRHGRDLKVDLGSRIRCDCLETLLVALAPMKLGKWVVTSVSFLQRAGDIRFYETEQRANVAIHEAVVAAYQLGLRGGVPPEEVRTCEQCGKPFLHFLHTGQQITLCLQCDEGECEMT